MIRWLPLLLLFAACAEDGDAGGDGTDPPAADASTGPPPPDGALPVGDGATAPDPDAELEPDPDAAPPIEWVAGDSVGPCEAPADLPADPLTRDALVDIRRSPLANGPIHMLDIEIDFDVGVIYTVGTGGLFTLRHTNIGLEVVGGARVQLGGRDRSGDFDKVEALGDGQLAVSHRETGWWLFDASDPADIRTGAAVSAPGASGMAAHDDLLYVLNHEGQLAVYDLADRDAPDLLHTMEGLGNPWDITLAGDRAYIADNALGVVVLDISDPARPTIVADVETLGGAQDLWLDGDRLYVAVGAAGIELMSLADPDRPTSVSAVDYNRAIVSVSAAGDLVWGANHWGVVVADVSDFEHPVPLAAEETEVWAMHVFAHRDGVYLADWTQAGYFAYDTGLRAPEVELARSEVPIVAGVTEATVGVSNRGGAPLEISGVSIDDPRFTVELSHLEVASGRTGQVRVTFADDGQPVDAELCIATNDPEQPLQRVAFQSSSAGSDIAVGESAPDFVLADLDGTEYRLSEQLGHPVVLVYFATW